MANPAALDLHMAPDLFRAAYADLLTLKVNRKTGRTASDSLYRAVAQWANWVDDSILAIQEIVEGVYVGTGSPEGVLSAEVGSVYRRTDGGVGTTLYVKQAGSGPTGWDAVAVGALDHGTLGGLADDDHPQYILTSGARSFTGSVTIAAPSGTITVGDGTGSPVARVRKADAGTAAFALRNLLQDRFEIELDASENVQLRTRDAAGTSTGATSIANATHAWAFPANATFGAVTSLATGFTTVPARVAQVGSTTGGDTVAVNLYVNDGTRNTRVRSFLTDGVGMTGSWGHQLVFGSGGYQPYVVRMNTTDLLQLAGLGGAASFLRGSPPAAVAASGGTMEIAGGAGGSTSGNGGALTCTGGTATDGNGGAATYRAADGFGTNRTGGVATLQSGNSTGTANGPSCLVQAGSGASGQVSNGGSCALDGGSSGGSGGTGGTLQARAGTGRTTGGAASLLGGGILGTPAFATAGAAMVRGGHATGATNGPGGPASLLGGDGAGNQAGGDASVSGGAAGPSGVGSSVILTARDSNAGGFSTGGDIRMTPGRGGSVTTEGTVEITGSITMQSTVSPAALAAGTTVDYSPSDVGYASFFRITPDGGGTSALGGLAGGQTGRRIILRNIGTTNLTIVHEDVGSTAAMRFRCPGAVNLVIPREGLREFIYDGASQKWCPIGAVA